MIVLVFGDVVGQAGCDMMRNRLPDLKKQYHVDIVVANGENSAEGNGILPYSANHLFDSGVDVITGGNHVLRRREIYSVLDENVGVIRPANLHKDAPGFGYYYVDLVKYQLCVINLQGMVYMNTIDNPFACIDALLPQITTPNIIVDFHAETTSEKLSMGFYLDGRVSAVLGTHTHVQTADERLLPNGTAYITDLGMCGGLNSVLGVKKELAIKRFVTGLPVRFENDPEQCVLKGVLLEIDEKTGKAVNIQRISVE